MEEHFGKVEKKRKEERRGMKGKREKEKRAGRNEKERRARRKKRKGMKNKNPVTL